MKSIMSEILTKSFYTCSLIHLHSNDTYNVLNRRDMKIFLVNVKKKKSIEFAMLLLLILQATLRR